MSDTNLSLAELAQKLEQLAAQNEDLKKQNDKLAEAIAVKNSVAIEEAPKAVIPEEPVTISGKKFKFTLPIFSFEGKTYRAEEAALDSKLLEKLAKEGGMGVLKAIK